MLLEGLLQPGRLAVGRLAHRRDLHRSSPRCFGRGMTSEEGIDYGASLAPPTRALYFRHHRRIHRVADETWSLDQLRAWLDRAMAAGRAGRARNGRPVDARPAVPGEIVVTTI